MDLSFLGPYRRASLSRHPYFYKSFVDFDDSKPGDTQDALRNLVSTPSFAVNSTPSVEYLEPLIQASNNSTGKKGKLSEYDIKRLRTHGSCTHRKIAVLLLEPTRSADETIFKIGQYLEFASNGVLHEGNTAILNCRALIPNASFNKNYEDDSKTGEYNGRAVKRTIKKLDPDVLIMCQCSVNKNADSFISKFTPYMRDAGKQTLLKMKNKFVHVVHAFHPSVVSKYQTDTRPDARRKAELQNSLLQFCFVLAVNLADGTDITGDGVKKLRRLALGVEE